MSYLKNSKYKKEILLINELVDKNLLKMDCEVIKPKTFKLFLIKLIDYYVNYYNTLNSKTNEITCGKGKHRSIMDLYKISKFYYPKLTFHKLFYTLVTLNKDPKKIYSLYCEDIKRIVCFTKNSEFNQGHCNYSLLYYYNKVKIDTSLLLNYNELIEIYEEYEKNK